MPAWEYCNLNPRSRKGSDQKVRDCLRWRIRFQTTLPQRERHDKRVARRGKPYFNPSSREGSDVFIHVANEELMESQSTLPQRERPADDAGRGNNGYYFNPRSREGSDTVYTIPTSLSWDFNPRSREGSDIMVKPAGGIPFDISIHAPAKGATQGHSPLCAHHKEFQSTLPRRERHIWRYVIYSHGCNFNPRSREGSDRSSVFSATLMYDFNPRSREGSDRYCMLR